MVLGLLPIVLANTLFGLELFFNALRPIDFKPTIISHCISLASAADRRTTPWTSDPAFQLLVGHITCLRLLTWLKPFASHQLV